jgi:glucosamine--fructose-6-phosphate aminotransferase (isomerizing)
VDALLADISRRGTRPVVLSNLRSSLDLASAPIALPADMPEWVSPIAAVVPGQLLAFHLSRSRGLDPDSPRGLRKVTKTM